MNDKILEELEILTSDHINEIEWKKVIRKGKVIRKLMCPDGYKAVDGRCMKMSPQETIKRKKAAKKNARKMKADKGAQNRSLKKRAKSMRKRAMRLPAQASKQN